MEEFTKYETARIIGARALQIAMDAPLILKVSDEKLKEVRYDAIKLAELEFKEGVLPISINRPVPRKGIGRLGNAREEKLSEEELIAKAQEVEREIVADAKEIGLVNEGDVDEDNLEEDGDDK